MIKKCNKCNIVKPIEVFQKRSSNVDGYTNTCKECKREYDNQYHKNRTKESKHHKYVLQKERIQKIRKFIYTYLQNKCCNICGESDIVVLEFHHTKDKLFNISDGIKRAYSLNKIKKEIDKCEILCANCHRKVTAKEQQWYKLTEL